MKRLIWLLLISTGFAQTLSTLNGTTVGTSAGNISGWNGTTIGTSAGNIGAWNGLTSPAGGGGGTTVYYGYSNTGNSFLTGTTSAPNTANKGANIINTVPGYAFASQITTGSYTSCSVTSASVYVDTPDSVTPSRWEIAIYAYNAGTFSTATKISNCDTGWVDDTATSAYKNATMTSCSLTGSTSYWVAVRNNVGNTQGWAYDGNTGQKYDNSVSQNYPASFPSPPGGSDATWGPLSFYLTTTCN